MNGDLLKFRVWNSIENKYDEEPFFIDMLGDLIKISEFDDNIDRVQKRDKFIVERCTGVKDRHGKLIYEGDVVDVYIPIEDAHRKCVVEYVIDGGTAQWICRYLNGSKRLHRTFGESFEITAEYLDGDYSTVIGNIHEVEK